MRTSTHFDRPLLAASIRGVESSFREWPSMSALAAISSSTTPAWPIRQATIRGVNCTQTIMLIDNYCTLLGPLHHAWHTLYAE